MKSYVFTLVNESLTSPLYSTMSPYEFMQYMETKRNYLTEIDTRYPNLVDFESFGRGMTRTMLVVREVANPYYLQAGFFTPYPRLGTVFHRMIPATHLPDNMITFEGVSQYLMALCKLYRRQEDFTTMEIINEVADFLEDYATTDVSTANGIMTLGNATITFNPANSLWEQRPIVGYGYDTKDALVVAQAMLEAYSLTGKFNYITVARKILDTHIGAILKYNDTNPTIKEYLKFLPFEGFSTTGVEKSYKSVSNVRHLLGALDMYLAYFGDEDRTGYASKTYSVQSFKDSLKNLILAFPNSYAGTASLPAVSIQTLFGTVKMNGAKGDSDGYVYSEDLIEAGISLAMVDPSIGNFFALGIEKMKEANQLFEDDVKFFDKMKYNSTIETYLKDSSSKEVVEISAVFLEYQRLIGNMQYFDDYVIDYIRENIIFDTDLNVDGLLRTDKTSTGGYVISVDGIAKILNTGLEYVVFEEGSRKNTVKVNISDLTSGQYDYQLYSSYMSNQTLKSDFKNKTSGSTNINPHFAGSLISANIPKTINGQAIDLISNGFLQEATGASQRVRYPALTDKVKESKGDTVKLIFEVKTSVAMTGTVYLFDTAQNVLGSTEPSFSATTTWTRKEINLPLTANMGTATNFQLTFATNTNGTASYRNVSLKTIPYEEFSQVSYGRISTIEGLGVTALTTGNGLRAQIGFSFDLKSQIKIDYKDFFTNKETPFLQNQIMQKEITGAKIKVKGSSTGAYSVVILNPTTKAFVTYDFTETAIDRTITLDKATLTPLIDYNGRVSMFVVTPAQTATPLSITLDYILFETSFDRVLIKTPTTYKDRRVFITELFIDEKNLDRFLELMDKFIRERDTTLFDELVNED